MNKNARERESEAVGGERLRGGGGLFGGRYDVRLPAIHLKTPRVECGTHSLIY